MIYLKIILFLEVLTILGLVTASWVLKRDYRALFRGQAPIILLLIPILILGQHPLVFLFVCMLCVPLAGGRPGGALAAYVFVLLLAPPMPTPITVGGIYLFTLVSNEMASLGLLLSSFFFAHKARVPLARAPTMDVLCVVIALAYLILSLTSEQGVAARSVMQTLISVVLPYLALILMVRTPQDVRQLMVAATICGLILAFIAFYEANRHWALYQEIYNIYAQYGVGTSGSSIYGRIRGGLLRASGPYAESTVFALFLGTISLIAVALPGIFRTESRRIVVILLMFGAIVFTVSRGPALAIGVGLVAIFAYRGFSRGAWLVLGAFAAFTLATFSAFQDFGGAGKISEAFQFADSTADYRREFIRMGWELIQAHPLTGVSEVTLGNYMASIRFEGFVDPVNAYIYWGARLGVGGIFLLALMTLMPLASLWRIRKYPLMPEVRAVAAALVGMYAAWAFGLATTSIHDRMLIWMLVMIAMTRAVCALPSLAAARSAIALSGARAAPYRGPSDAVAPLDRIDDGADL